MVSNSRRRALVAAFVVAPGVALAAPLVTVDAHAAPATGTVYLVQGVADTPMTITVDGKSVATGAPAKTIVDQWARQLIALANRPPGGVVQEAPKFELMVW